MEHTNFSSRTAEVKAIIAKFMARQEEPVERKEIAAYVLEQITGEVTDGVIAGAIKMMTASGELYPVQRGRYTKGAGKAKATAFEKIYNICRRFDSDLEKGCTFNMLELTEEEQKVYTEFSACTLELRNHVRESMEGLELLLGKVHELETGAIEPVGADGEETKEQKEGADGTEPEASKLGGGKTEAPTAEQTEGEQGRPEGESAPESAEAEAESHGTGRRGRRSKEK